MKEFLLHEVPGRTVSNGHIFSLRSISPDAFQEGGFFRTMFDPVTNINRSPIYKVINLHIIHHKQDEDTGRAMIRYHLFRKYFVTNITYGGVGEKYVDFFTGHINTLDRAYNKPTMETLREIYMRGEPYLRIYDESALVIAKIRE